LPWLIFLEEYGVAYEYLPGKKNMEIVADYQYCLGMDSLKIQEETKEVFTLLSGSEDCSISNIKSTIPMHNDLGGK
jgi:hypothetical protein